MIYTRFGTPVKLLTCEVAKETSARGETFNQLWVTAEQSELHPQGKPDDPTNAVGRPILDGKQFGAFELKADNGWGEILDACNALRSKVELDDFVTI